MNYSRIKNPLTGRYVKTTSNLGNQIIQNYIYQLGGQNECGYDEKTKRCNKKSKGYLYLILYKLNLIESIDNFYTLFKNLRDYIFSEGKKIVQGESHYALDDDIVKSFLEKNYSDDIHIDDYNAFLENKFNIVTWNEINSPTKIAINILEFLQRRNIENNLKDEKYFFNYHFTIFKNKLDLETFKDILKKLTKNISTQFAGGALKTVKRKRKIKVKSRAKPKLAVNSKIKIKAKAKGKAKRNARSSVKRKKSKF